MDCDTETRNNAPAAARSRNFNLFLNVVSGAAGAGTIPELQPPRRIDRSTIVEKVEVDPKLDLKQPADRLKTFRNWTNTAVRPVDLAKWGFFYTGRRDLVQCAFCNGRLQDWGVCDDPYTAHEEKYPQCPFVLGYMTYRNDQTGIGALGIGTNNNLGGKDEENNGTTNGNYCGSTTKVFVNAQAPLETDDKQLTGIKERLRMLGLCTSRPKYPEYATLQSRLMSFNSRNWPTAKKQSKDDLADAGFYYTGDKDRVQCFYCGGVLHNWEPTDQPWLEHARWFDKCDFIRLCKGDAFVQSAKNKLQAQENNSGADENLDTANRVTMDDLDAKIPSWQGHEDVRLAVDMGYEDQLIAAAVISNDITMFESVNELVERIEQIRPDWEKMKRRGTGVDLSQILPSAAYAAATASAEPQDPRLCKICMDGEVSVVFLPCAHLVSCPTCSPALQACPVCRTEAAVRLRVFTI